MMHYKSLVLLLLCGGLYGSAFLLPTVNPYNWATGWGPSPGLTAFRVGFTALTDAGGWDSERCLVAASWLANPVFWVGILCGAARQWRWAGWLGALSGVLALVVLPRYAALVADQPGYWLWVGSAAVLAGGSGLLAFGVVNGRRLEGIR
jgi:hypothetical protein